MKKKAILFLLTILLITSCASQKDPAVIAAEEAVQKAWFDKAVQALNDREFVLEAERITFRSGRSVYVNSNTNFVSLHGDNATVQIALNTPYAGPNGIGGITVDGRASNVKMETDKKGNISFSMFVTGAVISATVYFQMANGSNQCSVTVNPNFSNNRITFTGSLYSEVDSEVFKGRSL